jgi:hypothetical protein
VAERTGRVTSITETTSRARDSIRFIARPLLEDLAAVYPELSSDAPV